MPKIQNQACDFEQTAAEEGSNMPVHKPRWWFLYALVPFMAGLVIFEHDLVLDLLGHQLVQLGILGFVFGMMALWVRANEGNLIEESAEESILAVSRIKIYEACEREREGTVRGEERRFSPSSQAADSTRLKRIA